MADIRKFLDSAGVSALWGEVVSEVETKVAAEAAIARAAEKANKDAIDGHATRLTAAEGKIAALEAGTYDDTEVRGLIAGNTTAIKGVDGKVDALAGKVGSVPADKTVV